MEVTSFYVMIYPQRFYYLIKRIYKNVNKQQEVSNLHIKEHNSATLIKKRAQKS